jgi:phenylalanyl-tRNA synthetase alpha subunit
VLLFILLFYLLDLVLVILTAIVIASAVCKNVGWIEMGGAGMIHPNVLKMAGLDPAKCMGFAFGLGLDRWVMAKYKITDIRTLLGGNLAYKPDQHENII